MQQQLNCAYITSEVKNQKQKALPKNKFVNKLNIQKIFLLSFISS